VGAFLGPAEWARGERLVDEVGESGAVPERERLAEDGCRRRRVARGERLATLARQPHEAVQVDALWLELEPVSGRSSGDQIGAERFPELRNVDLDGMRRGVGHLTRPQGLDEAVDGDDVAGLECEHRQERAGLRPSQDDGTAASRRLERPEEP